MLYRMNNVRKQLRMANPKTIRVLDIARQNGFWHMGAFSNDYKKLFAAYDRATKTEGQPTVILAKTVKGWTLGKTTAGRNVAHQVKKLTVTSMMMIGTLSAL